MWLTPYMVKGMMASQGTIVPDRQASFLESHAAPAGFVKDPEVPTNSLIGGGKKNNEEIRRGTVAGTEKKGTRNPVSQQTH